MRNSNLTKLEVLETFEIKLGKLVSKPNLKNQKYIFFEIEICSNSKSSSSMKLEFDEM